MTAMVINGKEIAKEIRKKISEEIVILKKRYNITPVIATVIVENDLSSKLYLKLRDIACSEVGVISKHFNFNANVSEQEILQTIEELNNDSSVHGILIQYPVPNQLSQEKLMQIIGNRKDVEGLNPINLGRTFIGDEYLIPCTPLSVLTILEHEHIALRGKDIVIINHSNVVGKPLAAILLNRNATVAICHVFTKNLKQYTSKADIIITGAGIPKLITTDHIKENAIVLDVGIVQTKDGVCGDVDFSAVKEKASIISPVPGGIGPVTIACSLKNMVKTYRNCVENM
jgi:methylenetetrahydrofolate dehydrogenase (NADP+)/methenyltetrahydrofolate cyclohydrolase